MGAQNVFPFTLFTSGKAICPIPTTITQPYVICSIGGAFEAGTGSSIPPENKTFQVYVGAAGLDIDTITGWADLSTVNLDDSVWGAYPHDDVYAFKDVILNHVASPQAIYIKWLVDRIFNHFTVEGYNPSLTLGPHSTSAVFS